MFRIIKPADSKVVDVTTQPTIHGWKHDTVNVITKNIAYTGWNTDHRIQVTGESPGKRGSRRP